MATEIMATSTSTTELTLFHSILLTPFTRFALASLKMTRTISHEFTRAQIAEKEFFAYEFGADKALELLAACKKSHSTKLKEQDINLNDSKKLQVSERALMKTRILAMNPAKWLQTLWLHPLLN